MSKDGKPKQPHFFSPAMEEALTGLPGAELIYSLPEAELRAREVDKRLVLLRHTFMATVH